MPRSIDVDDEVFAALQDRAEPLVDTPNDVLRRVLRIGSPAPAPAPTPATSRSARSASGGRRAATGALLPEREYELPLLESLADLGGAAPMRAVLDVLETKLGSRLTPDDRDRLPTGGIRWRNRAQFVRLRLIEKGDMMSDSPRGLWEISPQGRVRLAAERTKRW